MKFHGERIHQFYVSGKAVLNIVRSTEGKSRLSGCERVSVPEIFSNQENCLRNLFKKIYI